MEPMHDTKYRGLLAAARLSGNFSSSLRGSCKKCGGVGHLTFQCRNDFLYKKDQDAKDLIDQDVQIHQIQQDSIGNFDGKKRERSVSPSTCSKKAKRDKQLKREKKEKKSKKEKRRKEKKEKQSKKDKKEKDL